MLHYSLQYLHSEGYRLTAFCEEQNCGHSRVLDFKALIAALGPDFIIPRQREYFLSRLRCDKCGGRKVGIILNAQGGYAGDGH